MGVAVVDPTDGEIIATGLTRLRVLEDGRTTGRRLAVAELVVPPRMPVGPPQHLHREHDETFYVVSGEPTFTSGAETVRAAAGTLVTAGIGTPHTFANPGDEPAVVLCTFTPDRYLGYFRELAELARRPGGLAPEAIAELMDRYATEVVRPGS
jgi:mannose-6-phosphate isomerase-like protein (cupin superfamily)